MDKKVIGTCYKCGGNVVKTFDGCRCENSLLPQPTCNVNVPSLIGGRLITDAEAAQLLSEREVILDNFYAKEVKDANGNVTRKGRNFSTVLSFVEDGRIAMNGKIHTCPHCGKTDIWAGTRAYECKACGFKIWRNIWGHMVTPKEAREICQNGKTAEPVVLYGKDGTPDTKYLGLSEDRNSIIRI